MTVRIGLADAHDARVQEAAVRLAAAGRVVPVLVGTTGVTTPPGAERITAPAGTTAVDHLARLVAEGVVAAGVGGSLTSSAEMIRAGIRRLRRGRLVSACFAIGSTEGRWTTYADCVVVPDPDAAQLAEIAVTAAEHHERTFGERARVAMLSFSTAGSAAHPRVRLVQEATRRVREEHPDLLVAGEVQFDVAVDPRVAARKAPGSEVAGAANVLVFPSLEAANIAYKVAERVGGATALGSFVLGLDRPWVDLSRGCSTDDIVATVDLLARAESADRASDPMAG